MLINSWPKFEMLRTSDLFLDAVECLIFFGETSTGGVRKKHDDGDGYQRDVYKRQQWINPRAENFNPAQCMTLEVSKRKNGKYAILDGGGRWLMAQLNGITELPCMVHLNLTREQEAFLFVKFDRERYRLRSVDTFLAQLAGGEPKCLEIAEAIQPIRVAVSGKGTVNCVGALMDIYENASKTLLSRTAKLIANTWMGAKSGDVWLGTKVDGIGFAAVAILLDLAPRDYEVALRNMMGFTRNELSWPKLEDEINKRDAGSRNRDKLTTAGKYRVAAEIMMRKANQYSGPKGSKLEVFDIKNSELLVSLSNRGKRAGASRFDSFHVKGRKAA